MDLDALRNLEHIDTECLVHIKTGYVCYEHLRKILRETLNLNFMDNLIKNTACLAADRCSLKLDAYMSPDRMACSDLIEINMMDAVPEKILMVCLH